MTPRRLLVNVLCIAQIEFLKLTYKKFQYVNQHLTLARVGPYCEILVLVGDTIASRWSVRHPIGGDTGYTSYIILLHLYTVMSHIYINIHNARNR